VHVASLGKNPNSQAASVVFCEENVAGSFNCTTIAS
jgi:hypothetical protein